MPFMTNFLGGVLGGETGEKTWQGDPNSLSFQTWVGEHSATYTIGNFKSTSYVYDQHHTSIIILTAINIYQILLVQPVYELLQLLHGDSPPIGYMTILVPLEDHLLTEHLSLVKQEQDLVEALEEVLVVVAILLNFIAENHLTLGWAGECRDYDPQHKLPATYQLFQILSLINMNKIKI